MKDLNGIRVSIISACRNESLHLNEFIDSILTQDMRGMNWEVIIADGMSDDGTEERLNAYSRNHPVLRVVPNPGKIVSTGLNAAIRIARGEIIIRMDAHTYYAADYCRRCVETLLETGADNVGGPARTIAQGVVGKAVSAAYHSRFSTGGARFHQETYEGWVDTVTYGCWRKETLVQLGWFDESLVRNQDDELNLRIIRRGGKIWQNPAIVSWYCPRTSLSGLFRQYFQYGYWKVRVIRKHKRPGAWRHLAPVSFLFVNSLLLAVMLIAGMAHATAPFLMASGLWIAIIGSYACANLIASILAARRHGWSTFPYLPVVFASYHVSYGFGFLMGMLPSLFRRSGTASTESIVAKLSR